MFEHFMCRCNFGFLVGSKRPSFEGQKRTIGSHGQVVAVDGNFDELVWKCRDCGFSTRNAQTMRMEPCN